MRKIDIFNHILPREIYDSLHDWVPGHMVLDRFARLPALWDLDAHFRVMDRFEGYQQVVSLSNPPIETLGDAEATPEIAARANDALSALCQRHPERFPGFVAALPMNNPDRAVREAERAVRDLNACGVQVYTNVHGKPLSAPELYPVFETMAGFDLPVWVHPMRLPHHADYAAEDHSEAEIWFTFGWPYETSASMARLIFSGLFDKLPGLKIITHHMGGMIPYFADKIALGFAQIFEGKVDHNPLVERYGLQKEPIDYYRMLYGDTATNGSLAAMACGHAFFTTERCLFATDAPFDPTGGVDLIGRTIRALEALPVTPAERERIFCGNAQELLKLS